MKKQSAILLAIGIILLLVLIFCLSAMGCRNKAIGMEERIKEAHSSIEIAKKKRKDAVKQLVQVAERYASHEKGIMDDITQARQRLENDDVTGAAKTIDVLVEAYPDIAAGEGYAQLMQEISTCENSILRSRENYNQQVKQYKRTVRSFPNKQYLAMMGYDALDYTYLEFNEELEPDENLFG